MIEAADHLPNDGHDLGMRVSQDRAHLAAGEVEHPTPGGVLDERARRPLGHERQPRRPVPHEVPLGASQIRLVGHRAILVAPPCTPTLHLGGHS